jgi:choline-sulfatase
VSRSAPDIVVFLTDDHAQWGLPCYGDGVIAAPSLDRLAAGGTVFENGFTATPVCSPARASFLTGLMPAQHGIHDFLQSQPRFDRPWLDGLPTLAQRLSAEGYHCGFIGKWHAGRDAEPHPGFDHWFALNGEYPIHHDGDNGFSRNGVIERETGNLTDILTREARRFLAERDRHRPYFLFVGHYATHSPWIGQPERLVANYRHADFSHLDAGTLVTGLVNPESPGADAAARQEARAHYCAAVSHIDESVGTILADIAGQGGLAETLVVYTADHGLCLGQHGIWGKGNATRPQNMLDRSIAIPLIMAGPGVPAGQRSAAFASHCDLHATLLSAAGAPAEPRSPGHDLLPVLSGESPAAEMVFGEYGDLRMVRDAEYKLLAWRDGRQTLHAVGAGEDETEVLAEAPETEEIRQRLARQLEAFFSGLSGSIHTHDGSYLPLTYNRNQAWQPFVPPQPAGKMP